MDSKMNWKSEIIAFAFGMLLILITFGDSHLVSNIGNLDTVFGESYWKLIDVIYPAAAIIFFLLYGKVKGGITINVKTTFLFVSYLIVLALISQDDLALVLHVSKIYNSLYWTVVEWIYPIYSVIAFFLFGELNQVSKSS
jgi:hypothetical protein